MGKRESRVGWEVWKCWEGAMRAFFSWFFFLIEVLLIGNIILVSGIQHSGVVIMYISNWSLWLTIDHYSELLQYYWLFSLCWHYIPMTFLFYNLRLVSLNSLHLFLPIPHHPCPETNSFLFVYMSRFTFCFVWSFVLVFRLHIQVKYSICFSLTYFT